TVPLWDLRRSPLFYQGLRVLGKLLIPKSRVVSSLRWVISDLPALPAPGRGRSEHPRGGSRGAHFAGPAVAAGSRSAGLGLAVFLRIHLDIAAAQQAAQAAGRDPQPPSGLAAIAAAQLHGGVRGGRRDLVEWGGKGDHSLSLRAGML